MRVHPYAVEQASGDIPAAVGNARTAWTTRTGLLLRVRSESGLEGMGEASPLPGYSPDCIEDARSALLALPDVIELDLETSRGWLHELEQALGAVPASVPSARFALETAVLDVVGKALHKPIARLIGTPLPEVPWAGVVEASRREEALGKAERLGRAGVATIKVKIDGAEPLSDTVDWLHLLAGRLADSGGRPRTIIEPSSERARPRDRIGGAKDFGGRTKLRLDANRTIPASLVRAWTDRLSELRPEFLEEPIAPERLPGGAPVAIPLALDESLQGMTAAELESIVVGNAAYRVVVLKPTVLGGLLRCMQWAKHARRLGLGAVVSHTLEGPVAWSACAALALCVQDQGVAAGLEPHAALAAWPAMRLPALDGTRIVDSALPGLGLP